jgi:thiamine biosynthesis protein ThiS
MTINLRLLGYYQLIIGTMYMEVDLPVQSSLEDLWDYLVSGYRQMQSKDMKMIAGITVNKEFISRGDWHSKILIHGDRVDLVSQMAGG